MEKLFEKLRNNKYFHLLIVLCLAISFYMVLNNFNIVVVAVRNILRILSPVVLGAVIAYILYPIVLFFENKAFRKMKKAKTAHALSSVLALILFIAVIVLLIYLVVPQLAESLTIMIDNIEGYSSTAMTKAESYIAKLEAKYGEFNIELLDLSKLDWKNIVGKTIKWLGGKGEGLLGAGVNVGRSFANTFIALMFALYMLLDVKGITDSIKRYIRSHMSVENYARFAKLCADSNIIFSKYFGGNLLDSLIIGIACFLFMKITRLPYALLISVVVAITNFIPTFGPIIGLVICGFLILLVNPLGALWFTIYTVVSQAIDGNILKPIIFGDSTGLSPMWVLAAIIVGGGLFGMIGMLLGVPVAAIIGNIMKKRVSERLAEKGYEKAENEMN